ncbi:MAG TPA: efflux RND transporter periplasmic adaptor subunit [Steroidobacteraceae bacterium]|nr:efflux RND transporter periplasmic adaptor subunit [Steroidobacteraceae bacterium]
MTRSRSMQLAAIAVIGLAAAATAVIVMRRLMAPDTGLVQVSGRIEADKVTLASRVTGRVMAIRVREGDTTRPGEVMALIDDRTVQAQLAGANAAAASAANQAASAQAALAVLRREVPNAVASAEAGLAQAAASLRQAQGTERQAGRDSARAQALVAAHLMDTQSAQRSALAWNVAQEQVAAALAGQRKAEQALRDALIGPLRIKAQEAALTALESARAQAEARVREVRTLLDELTITAPLAATVTGRFVNIGEVVNVGTPLYELVDLDHLYLQVYVPEKEIGKVRLGLPAQVFTDAFPGRAFPATVRYIASRAEFTPKEVQTPDERVKLVYEVRLYLDANPEHRLTPGLPGDAMIRWRTGARWHAPLW